jgi:hypothetical protein
MATHKHRLSLGNYIKQTGAQREVFLARLTAHAAGESAVVFPTQRCFIGVYISY